MKRGDIVVVSPRGSHGKPRPAVVIQSDALNGGDSVLVSLLTSDLAEAGFYRLSVQAAPANGLQAPSQIMVDKIVALPRNKCSKPIGSLEKSVLLTLNHMLAVMIGIAD